MMTSSLPIGRQGQREVLLIFAKVGIRCRCPRAGPAVSRRFRALAWSLALAMLPSIALAAPQWQVTPSPTYNAHVGELTVVHAVNDRWPSFDEAQIAAMLHRATATAKRQFGINVAFNRAPTGRCSAYSLVRLARRTVG
ncbi:MAG: hypothetical protein HOI95_16175 [Chromatiales bacterium]|nr:hypothetical protein [Chromatiales bacterium]